MCTEKESETYLNCKLTKLTKFSTIQDELMGFWGFEDNIPVELLL